MVGKFPACVLNITMPPELCDVNVSPSKTEVRFAFDKNVFDAINFGVKNAILNADNRRDVVLQKKEIPEEKADLRSSERVLAEKVNTAIANVRIPSVNEQEPVKEPERTFVPEEKPVIRQSEIAPFRPVQEEQPFVQQRFVSQKVTVEFDEDEDDKAYTEREEPGEIAGDAGKTGFRYITGSALDEKPAAVPETSPEVTAEEEKPPLKVIGEIFETYIVCTCGEQFILMDKHAAHERINFENRRKQLITTSQLLAESIVVELDTEQLTAVGENTDRLADIGIDVVLTEDGKCEITAAPSTFIDGERTVDPALMLIRAADALAAGGGNADITAEIYGDFQHTRACKAAIKAHDNNTLAELTSLAETVWNDERIRFCPHGRPIMVKLSEYEIEKYFSRIQ